MPYNVPSFLQAKIKLSVEINGIWIPFNRALDSLARHVYPLLHFIENESAFDLGQAGSSLLVRHEGNLLQIFSNHQLTNIGIDAGDVVICRNELPEHTALGPCEILTPTTEIPQHANLNDIKLVRYDSPNMREQLDARFLQNSLLGISSLRDVQPDSVELLFATGFPTKVSNTDFAMDDTTGEIANVHVHSRSVKLYFWTSPGLMDNFFFIEQDVSHAENKEPVPDGISGTHHCAGPVRAQRREPRAGV